MFESGLRTKTSSKTIRESPPNPLKLILTVIFVSSIARDSPLKSGGNWGHSWGQVKAIEYLRSIGTAKLRRPNSRGNWGIVSAVRWDKLEK